ncbi:MAG: SapC family protein [Alphaproteobacteria bacterium]
MANLKKDKPAAATQQGQPMFYVQPVPLDAKRHEKAGCTPTANFTFAAETNSIPLNVAEFVEAAKVYPIVFTQGENPSPVVIVGLEQQNYFVDGKGNWRADTYIPAYVRKYPFVFMGAPEQEQFVLCVDEAAHQFRVRGGKDALALFTDGKASDMARMALEFCTAYHNHHRMSMEFTKALADAGLLASHASSARLFNGRTIRLGGFQVVDEKKFNALPDEKILEFKKKGWLPFIYFSLLSVSNFKRLADLAGAREPSAV